MSFDDDMKKLDETVAWFEKGGMSVDEALSRFEEGVKLIKQCRAFLDGSKRRVEMLLEECETGSDAEP